MNGKRIGFLLTVNVGLALSQSPSFEVASVKPHPIPAGQMSFRFANDGPTILRSKGNRFIENVATLQDLIMDSYGVKNYQILGMADWAKTPRGEHYDIDARSGSEAQPPTSDQLQLMLQGLLSDRFKLKLHRETRELPVYALVAGKNGPKLRELSEAETIAAKASPRLRPVPSAPIKTTMFSLVGLLSNVVDRPVIDDTGLTGMYEYASLDWLDWREREVGSLSQ